MTLSTMAGPGLLVGLATLPFVSTESGAVGSSGGFSHRWINPDRVCIACHMPEADGAQTDALLDNHTFCVASSAPGVSRSRPTSGIPAPLTMCIPRSGAPGALGDMPVEMTPQGSGIVGSKHDFSAETWNSSGEICLPCHIPHTATPNENTELLWNHSVTTATFQIYTSPTLRATPEQPRGPSRLCLGCHDGTVALDSFSGQTGSHFITGNANLGTDLTSDHPISIEWTHKGVGTCTGCHFVHGNLYASPLPLYEGRVECATCHDPHDMTPQNPVGNYMLRLTIEQSAICLWCHHK